MLGVLRMNIKAGSTQKHRTFFSGNVEMLWNLKLDIKGGVHKSSDFLERSRIMMKRVVVIQQMLVE